MFITDRRLLFQGLLESLVPNVYFQPPSDDKIVYPCIVYEEDDMDTKFANNLPYGHTTRYMVTVIDPDPDSEISKKVADLPMSRFSRKFPAENLHHTIFNVYF